MADFVLLGLFDSVETTTGALDDLSELGVGQQQVEIMSNVPYPAEFFGHNPPRLWLLPWVALGALGGAGIAFFITVITPLLYPIHVGGQPLVAPFPPTAIMFFEFIALGAMVMAFVGFLVQSRFPVITRKMYDPRITDGYIGLAARVPESLVDRVAGVFEAHRARAIRREDAAAFPDPGMRQWLMYGAIAAALGVALLVPLLFTYQVIEIPWFNRMDDTVVTEPQQGPRRAAPPEAVPVQGPVLIAGQPATVPLEATDQSIARGATLFATNCSMCHGPEAQLDQARMAKYFPEAANLRDADVQSMPPQEIFLVITLGRNRMPSIGENLNTTETWDIVNYVLSLDGAGS